MAKKITARSALVQVLNVMYEYGGEVWSENFTGNELAAAGCDPTTQAGISAFVGARLDFHNEMRGLKAAKPPKAKRAVRKKARR